MREDRNIEWTSLYGIPLNLMHPVYKRFILSHTFLLLFLTEFAGKLNHFSIPFLNNVSTGAFTIFPRTRFTSISQMTFKSFQE